jgi:hypothetical protein
MRMKLIPPEPPGSPFEPKGRLPVPMPQDLAEHRPIRPYDDDDGFAEQLDQVHRAAAVLVQDPLRDIALAVQGLSYKQKAALAAGLRTSVMRLTAWASFVLEAR